MKLYGLKTCDTCRKALKALRDAGHEVEFHDLRADGLPAERIAEFHARFGDILLNRRSTTWRNLSEAEREHDPVDLIVVHPTLMKRPVIDVDGTLHLGWDATTRAELT
ncbi:arsenate reductase family protein [Palleronia sp. LCG004]|uniref:arsenate reductase family protein n=1 Tax=Palleronia sp. LCG004 TaxID=3079304 RepID=UPI002941CE1B|nr:ArsC/Spx/MgsR family protein [Palleronia sp. LCG004]WOI57356.1 ArsC/Spx/MgsR family protein [Palleronia sp. LCG004]